MSDGTILPSLNDGVTMAPSIFHQVQRLFCPPVVPEFDISSDMCITSLLIQNLAAYRDHQQ